MQARSPRRPDDTEEVTLSPRGSAVDGGGRLQPVERVVERVATKSSAIGASGAIHRAICAGQAARAGDRASRNALVFGSIPIGGSQLDSLIRTLVFRSRASRGASSRLARTRPGPRQVPGSRDFPEPPDGEGPRPGPGRAANLPVLADNVNHSGLSRRSLRL
jgi:hypothetical protein